MRRAWLLLAAPVALVAALPLLVVATGEPMSTFTRDVFSIAEIPVYAGLASNAGAFLWCGTAAVCLFAAFAGAPRHRALLAGFGALSAVFLVDDFLLVHEWLAPRVLGVHEMAVYAAYGAALVALLAVHRDALRARRPVLLAVALGLFAASVGLDAVERPPAPGWFYFVEESLKLLGIAAWAGYFVALAAESVREGTPSIGPPRRTGRAPTG